jgi:hypothetical protein
MPAPPALVRVDSFARSLRRVVGEHTFVRPCDNLPAPQSSLDQRRSVSHPSRPAAPLGKPSPAHIKRAQQRRAREEPNYRNSLRLRIMVWTVLSFRPSSLVSKKTCSPPPGSTRKYAVLCQRTSPTSNRHSASTLAPPRPSFS